MYKVSVLVPVYNTEKTLEMCIDSILRQSIIQDIEIVIVNDGSTDNSQDIIDNYVNKYKNIVAYKQINSGLGATRNKGIELASGEYIAFLDSDDWVDEDYYELMYKKAIDDNSELVISSYMVDMKNLNQGSRTTHNEEDKVDYIRGLLRGNIAGFSWNKLYKKELIIKNKLQFPLRGELENVEDQYFSLRCVALANRLSFMNLSDVHYVIHSQSIVRKYQEGLYEDILNLYRRNKEFLSSMNDLDFKIHELDILLVRALSTIVNNEFKPERKVGKLEKIKVIKSALGIEEYRYALKNFNNYKFSKIDYIYFKLMNSNKLNLLYIIASLRCRRMHLKSKIYN